MTKKITHSFALAFLLVAFSCNHSFAQLSDGGTPSGFKWAPSNRLPVELMPPVDVVALRAEDVVNDQYKNHPFRFGYNHMVNYGLTNSGTWTTLFNGDRIWQLDVKSQDALTINLGFSHFNLPVGAKLFIYSKDHSQILGAFTSKNNYADHFFGSELVNGDEVVVEYYEPAAVHGQGSLILFRVTHGYRSAYDFAKSFGQAGACQFNSICPQFSASQTVKRSVICLVQGGGEFCSASLVNNTANDGTPYVLTANHCGTPDGTWVFRFNWESPTCANPGSNPASNSITGGSQLAHTTTSDFNLALMSATPPSNFNVFYAGWDHSGIPATSVTGIHHPSGDIKKTSLATNPVTRSSQDLGNGQAEVWQIGTWTTGCTEGGSSGSPLFDQNLRIIGQLYGGPSICGGTQMWDYYGRFSVSWDTFPAFNQQLKHWLDPGNTGAITNDGYDPNLITVPLDASLTAVISPTGSSCNTTINPVVTLRNVGTTTLTSALITYSIDAQPGIPFSWNGSLATGISTNVNLSSMTVTAGAHTFHAVVSSPNGGTDGNHSNDSTNGAFTIINAAGVAVPFIEGFVNATFPPTNWSINNPNADNTWVRNTTVGGFGTSTNSADIDQFTPVSTTAGELDDLITPFIDLSTVSTPAWLKFDVAYARYDATHSDTLKILASIDCGTTWTTIYYKGGSNLATAPDVTTLFTPTNAQWRSDSVNISSNVGNNAVLFKFEEISGWGNVMYLDNINIYGTSSVTLDANLNTLTVPASSVCNPTFISSFTLTNSGTTTLTSVNINYQLDGGGIQTNPWSGSLAPGNSAVVTLPAIAPTAGNHVLRIFSSSPNGGTDGNHTNDTIVKNFTAGTTPIVALGGHAPQCAGTITLDAGNAGSSFAWSNGATTQTTTVSSSNTYTVTVTSNTCSATGSATVTINPLPNVTLQFPSALDTVCTSQGNVTLSGGSPAGGSYSGTNVNAGMFNAGAASPGTYSVLYSYTDGNGCSNTASQNIVVTVCTGIGNAGNNISTGIFPNPFGKTFTVQFTLSSATNISANLYSVDGKLVQSILNGEKLSAGNHQFEINTSGISNGVYFLRVNHQYIKVEKME